jgi:two-component sensor histidine kinase/predicted Zn-dependent protease
MFHYQAFCILLLSILAGPFARVSGQNSDPAGDSRIVDFDREPVYLKVFVDTDNFGPSYLDSLEAAYLRVDIDTIKFEILNDLAYYWHTRSLNKSLGLATDGLEMARAAGNMLWEGRFQITQGATLLRMEKLDSAQAVLQKARKKVKDEDLPLLLTQEGYIYERRGDLDMATEKAYEALNLGERMNDERAIAVAYSDLSNLFWKYERFEEGLEFGLKSIDLFESRGLNDMDYDFTLYVVGNNYRELGNTEKALNYFNHSIAMGERYGFYNNLSDAYISLIDLYADEGDFELALDAGLKAVELAERIDNDFLLMRSYLSLGRMYNLQGRFSTAIESLKKSLDIIEVDFGDKYFLSQLYENLARAYAGNHNYKDAMEAFSEYDRLKDELFTEQAEQKISNVQTRFEMAKRDDTILDQKEQLKKQKTSQTLISVIAILLFLLLLVLYITFQNNKRKNELLEKQNKEKEFLLKEIHHRVKNNLGIISSLLDLQSAEIRDPKVVEAIHESQNRVYSMSMIHQKLYQGKNLSAVEMKDYFMELSDHILDSFGLKNRIEFTFNMEEIELDVDMAIPLGLIVNELITNSLKHAFPKDMRGRVDLYFRRTENNTIRLEVTDNGVGIDRIVQDKNKEGGFGTKLIGLLVQQLDATINRRDDEGTAVLIEFSFA